LVDIYVYIAQDNPKAAQKFVDDISDKIHWIASTGFAGHPRDYIRPDLRAFLYRDRCIYFRLAENKTIISRILHGKMDVNLHDFPE
jgi:toxin ParE1/3/4